VVVTGGSSIMHGVPELAEQVFDMPVRRGVPTGLSGLSDVVQSPIHATAVGLALYGARGHGAGGPTEVEEAARVGRIGRRLRDWFAELF
jgi:cell division protein FtsA